MMDGPAAWQIQERFTLPTLGPLGFPCQKVLGWTTFQLILNAFTLPTQHPNNKYTQHNTGNHNSNCLHVTLNS